MLLRHAIAYRPLSALAAAACLVLAAACSGLVGPAQPTLPLETIELAAVPQTGTVGDRFPLKVIATYVHGTTEEVTSRVTWTSSNEATAAVVGGELVLVGVGESQIRASLEAASASFSVSVQARPPGRSTLSGVVADSASRKGVPTATVQVVDGPNAGQSAVTDESGFFSLPSLVQSTFTIRVIRSAYESTEQTIALAADTRVDVLIKALPPPPFTGGTYDIRVSVARNDCGVDFPSSGRLVLSGTPRRLTIRITQSGIEREYAGGLESDGTFTGSMGLAAASSVESIPHGVSTIKGLIVDTNISGTEKIASHLCPSGLGIVGVGFAGTLR